MIRLLEKKHYIDKRILETDRRATEIHPAKEIDRQINDIERKLMDVINKALSGVMKSLELSLLRLALWKSAQIYFIYPMGND